MRLIRSLAAVVVSLFAASAGATVSVNLVASGSFTPGSLITLRTYVTANGGETDINIFGAIDYPDAAINPNQPANTQVEVFDSVGSLPCQRGYCVAFNQINSTGPIALNVTAYPRLRDSTGSAPRMPRACRSP